MTTEAKGSSCAAAPEAAFMIRCALIADGPASFRGQEQHSK